MMKAMMIVGLSGVGKTSAGEYLNAHTAAIHLEASKYMRQIWSERGEIGTLQSFASSSLISNPTLVADRILHDSHRMGIDSVVITGFRSPSEVSAVRGAVQQTSLLLLTSDPTFRLNRLLARARKGDPIDLRELAELDQAHVDMGMGELVSECDDLIDNDQSRAAFHHRLEAHAKHFFTSVNNTERAGKSRSVSGLRTIGTG
ncbi:AAA family ATPase [Rhizobium sp. CCGE 510]|uniref:AAA family ATPase n=1 Tax=Rhizobium sp. CCGE 510 TaxID=1132836 RepID=UPI00027B8BF1|nr:AAA family ATPase [Rhizobium sp. CCGE 510]EJT06505.1 Dephospho-CoA kinase, CoaE [Rhizobium sp. CCGE 510]